MADSDEEQIDYEPEDFVIGPFNFRLTTIAFMPISVLMKNRTKNVEQSGQKLWCGSLVVAAYILQNNIRFDGKSCIELGAGTGLLSLLADKLGAAVSLATDHDSRSLSNMQSDVQTNASTAVVQALDWYNPDIDSLNLSRESALFILAGDVLYKEALIEPFLTTTSLLFDHCPSSIMYLCHVPRAGVSQSLVINRFTERGFNVAIVDRTLWGDYPDIYQYCPPEDLTAAGLYIITR